VENKRPLSPVILPDLQAMLMASDAGRRTLGLPHTLWRHSSTTCKGKHNDHMQPIKTQLLKISWSKTSILVLAAHKAPPLRAQATRDISNV
jgi:hypothetical protein